jgi:hypothetical protein
MACNYQIKAQTLTPSNTHIIISDLLTRLSLDLINKLTANSSTPHHSNSENLFSSPVPKTHSTLQVTLSTNNPIQNEHNEPSPYNNETGYEFHDDEYNHSISEYELMNDDYTYYSGAYIQNILVHAPITHIDLINHTLEVTPVTGQPAIIIQIDAETQFYDDYTGRKNITINELNTYDFIEITGFESNISHGIHTITASEISISNSNTITIQAPIQTNTIDLTLKVLNIEFIIDDSTQLTTYIEEFYEDNLHKLPPSAENNSAQQTNHFIQYYSQETSPSIWAKVSSLTQSTGLVNHLILTSH